LKQYAHSFAALHAIYHIIIIIIVIIVKTSIK